MMPKAIVVCPYYYPDIGGLEQYARQLNKALVRYQNFEIVVITSSKTRRSYTDSIDNTKVFRLATWFKISNTPFNLYWPIMIRAIIKRESPDVIIAHAPVPSMADAAALAKGTIPFIYFYHAATLKKDNSPLFNMAEKLYSLLGNNTFHKAVAVCAVSRFVKLQLPEQIQRKTFVVPNAVWDDEIVNRDQPLAHNFLFVASLKKSHDWKGLDQILLACKLYKANYGNKFSLTVLGDGDNRGYYEQQASDLGIANNVIFKGSLQAEAKDRAFADAAALLVYPTTSNDAFPTVLVEAWARSVLVIVGAIGPLPSLVEHAKTGFVCDARSPQALTIAMHNFSQLSKIKRSVVAEQALDEVKNNYTWRKQAERLAEII